MSLAQTVKEFHEFLGTYQAFVNSVSIWGWDSQTGAPKGGAPSRSKRMGIVQAELFKMFNSSQMGAFLYKLSDHVDELDEITLKMYEQCKKRYDRALNTPPEFVQEMAETQSMAGAIWRDAKVKSDYQSFMPHLLKMIDCKRRFASYIDPHSDPYDVLLDDYEPGMNQAVLDAYFEKLRSRIVPLLGKVTAAKKQVDESFRSRFVPIETQKKLAYFLMDKIGYDLNFGRLDEAEHPFSASFGKYDCRITTHYYENDFMASSFSVMHECGHAFYEMHKMDEIADTILDRGASNGMHESQSRFYENYIGRSWPFWQSVYEEYAHILGPDFKDVDARMFFEAANRVKCTLTRVESDELTYSLHIMLRYEIEKMLLKGGFDPQTLPGIWNEKVKEYLGIDVPDDRRGILQDVHWSSGLIGYFPTYSLGSAYGAQFFGAMKKDLDFDNLVLNGQVPEISRWLTDKIQKFGLMRTPEELMINATGQKFNPDFYLDYLEDKYTKLYEL